MKVKVYAKLNLMLSVGARNGEFHPIDSVATSVDICDVVEVVPRADDEIVVSGMPQVATEQNSAYKAAKAFQTVFLTNGVSIYVQKGIPFGGGLGGSSADAAAVVYCMCKLFGVDIHSKEVHEICAKLGSDINFMLFGGLGRLQGKGDDVTYSKMAKPLYFALTTFDVSMSSKEVYNGYDEYLQCSTSAHGPSVSYIKARLDCVWDMLVRGYNMYALQSFENDLQLVIENLYDYSKNYSNFISEHQLHCNMTGSGSAYYVACESREQAQRVTDLLNANGFATTVCQSVPSGIEEI